MKGVKSIVLAWLAALSLNTHAALLAGTQTGAPYAGRVAIGEYGFGEDYPIMQARPFRTGSSLFRLESILFSSHLYWENGAGRLLVSLHADNGGVPGSPLAGGSGLFSAPAGSVDQMLNASSSLTLPASTTYWLVASADQTQGATRFWWELTDSALFDSDAAGAGLPLRRANDALGWIVYSDASMQVSLYGTAVPEPATLAFFSVGGFFSWLMRRKRMRRMRLKHRPGFEELVYIRPFMDEEHLAPALNDAHVFW